jgi:hypothetical protein
MQQIPEEADQNHFPTSRNNLETDRALIEVTGPQPWNHQRD